MATLEAEILACIRSSSALPRPHSRNSLDLPVELWSTVWLNLPFSSRVAASQTCRQWRINTLACQDLWTDICVQIWDDKFCECAICEDTLYNKRRSSTQIAPTRLAQLLGRSGKRDVSLEIIIHGQLDYARDHVVAAIAEGLINHAQRVRSLYVHASDNVSIPKLVHQLPILGNMKHLKVSSLEENEIGFLLTGTLDAPRLEQVMIGGSLLGLASPEAVQAISLPSLKALQCTVSSAQELVDAVRIAATGSLKSLHLCLSCFVEEDFTMSLTNLSLICSLLAAMPLSSITMANMCSQDEQLIMAFAQLKVNHIIFQLFPGASDIDESFTIIPSSLLAPTELIYSRVQAVDGGYTTNTLKESLRWFTFSVIDTNHATLATGVAHRRDLYWDMSRLQQLPILWDKLPNDTYQSLRVMTIDSDLLHIFQGTEHTNLTWPNVHTVAVQVVPEGIRLASPVHALPMLSLPALKTLKVEASLTQDIIWLDIEVFRHSILLPILGDRMVELMLFTGITLHSAEVPVQLSELARNAKVICFE